MTYPCIFSTIWSPETHFPGALSSLSMVPMPLAGFLHCYPNFQSGRTGMLLTHRSCFGSICFLPTVKYTPCWGGPVAGATWSYLAHSLSNCRSLCWENFSEKLMNFGGIHVSTRVCEIDGPTYKVCVSRYTTFGHKHWEVIPILYRIFSMWPLWWIMVWYPLRCNPSLDQPGWSATCRWYIRQTGYCWAIS